MELWEDELLLDDDFSDEEEDAEEQIEETGLEIDADGFADWEDSSDTAPVDETLEEGAGKRAGAGRASQRLSCRAGGRGGRSRAHQ